MTKKLAAVLWDMDGTIVDSEPFWLEAEYQIARKYGVEWTLEDAISHVGLGIPETALSMQQKGVPLEIDEIVDAMNVSVVSQLRESAPWRPGALELIQELKTQGIPMALVTMSYQEMAHLVNELTGLDAFDVIVTGDTVRNSKPHPEPYLKAAAELGVDIEQCVAFEDSVNGAASAVASGALTVAIPNHVDIPDSDSYLKISTLSGVSIADLQLWLDERKKAA